MSNLLGTRLMQASLTLMALSCAILPLAFAQPLSQQEELNLRGAAPNWDMTKGTQPIREADGFQPANIMPSKKNLFLYNADYPPARIAVYPPSPEAHTDFVKMLGQDLEKTQALQLTENLENADYRVTLSCAGVSTCSELRVFIATPKRDVLNGFTVKNVSGPFGIKRRPISEVTAELSAMLNQRIAQMEQGDLGYSHY